MEVSDGVGYNSKSVIWRKSKRASKMMYCCYKPYDLPLRPKQESFVLSSSGCRKLRSFSEEVSCASLSNVNAVPIEVHTTAVTSSKCSGSNLCNYAKTSSTGKPFTSAPKMDTNSNLPSGIGAETSELDLQRDRERKMERLDTYKDPGNIKTCDFIMPIKRCICCGVQIRQTARFVELPSAKYMASCRDHAENKPGYGILQSSTETVSDAIRRISGFPPSFGDFKLVHRCFPPTYKARKEEMDLVSQQMSQLDVK